MQNQRIPLYKRLKQARISSSPFLTAYELPAADISSEIYKITGNNLLIEHYRKYVEKYIADEDTNILYFLSQLFYTQTSDESLKLKYYVLIEPFALLYEHERKQQKDRRRATATERRTANE